MKNVLLVGAGPMAVCYTKVLQDMGISVHVIGRGQASAEKYESETGIKVYREGQTKDLLSKNLHFDGAIVAVTEEELGKATASLLELGISKILIEKPGATDAQELRSLHEKAQRSKSQLYVGYNRRFYSSVRAARDIMAKEGGPKSFTFDFTERSHKMGAAKKADIIKKEWFLHNSSHVVDMAFFLGGNPSTMSCYTSGTLSWHPAGEVFSGAGRTHDGALFSYASNWSCPGRWGVEVVSAQHRFIFRPLEKLQVQKLENFDIHPVAIDDSLDVKFKPGIYLQTKSFLSDCKDIPTLKDQVDMLPVFDAILNGRSL